MEYNVTYMIELFAKITELVESLGYIGIFIMTFVESTFVPIPSEITLIPAGYLIADGVMGAVPVVVLATVGTVTGALFNYAIARVYGRAILLRYSKYLFITKEKLDYIESFFCRYGALSTFSGRILPGVKHFISFPAGLARMNLPKFAIYTAAGGLLWNSLLISLGYYIGHEEQLIKKHLHNLNVGIVVLVITVGVGYMIKRKRS